MARFSFWLGNIAKCLLIIVIRGKKLRISSENKAREEMIGLAKTIISIFSSKFAIFSSLMMNYIFHKWHSFFVAEADILFFYSTKPGRVNFVLRSGRKVDTFQPENIRILLRLLTGRKKNFSTFLCVVGNGKKYFTFFLQNRLNLSYFRSTCDKKAFFITRTWN